MSEKADGEAIEIECVWPEEDFKQIAEIRQTKRMNALPFRYFFLHPNVFLFAALYFFIRAFTRDAFDVFLNPFIFVDVALIITAIFAFRRFRTAMAHTPTNLNYRLEMNYYKARGTHQIRLNPRGVVHHYGDTVVDAPWRDVSDVSEIGAGVVIWRADMVLAILPDEALPAGLDRARLLSRISAWREAARD